MRKLTYQDYHEYERRVVAKHVVLWLELCRCPGEQWHPTATDLKLERHSRTCEFRQQMEREGG